MTTQTIIHRLKNVEPTIVVINAIHEFFNTNIYYSY
jgi:hypothetical protein